MRDILFRDIRLCDWATFESLEKACWGDRCVSLRVFQQWHRDFYMSGIFTRGNRLDIGDRRVEAEQIVGGVVSESQGEVNYIKSFCVHPEWQGQGYGRYLMNAHLAVMKRRKTLSVRVHTRESNQVAQSFYKSLGFTHYENLSRFYPNCETAIGFRKDV